MSRRLRLLNIGLRTFVRPLLARTSTPERARREFDLMARVAFRGPSGVVRTGRRVAAPGRPLDLSRITCGPVAQGMAVLYFHGGGYVAGSARTHSGMLGRLSVLSGVAVHAPDYRLAEEAPFPAAFEDAMSAWEALIAEGFAPEDIVLGGDSAGGGLGLALFARLCAEGARPAGLFAFSPWTDLTLGSGSLASNASRDALLPAERIHDLVDIVLAGADPRDPRVSPLHATFDMPPPVYLQASRTEILLDDTLRMADHLRGAGAEVSVDLWPDAPHVWQIFDGWIPEARDALGRTADFVRARLRLPPRPAGN